MTETDITIPRETLEAAAMEMAPHPWSMYTDAAKEHFRDKARAACIAMLRAWPGIKEHAVQVPDDASDDIRYTLKKIGIILPLTENANDKG